jgi:hypothetical protein
MMLGLVPVLAVFLPSATNAAFAPQLTSSPAVASAAGDVAREARVAAEDDPAGERASSVLDAPRPAPVAPLAPSFEGARVVSFYGFPGVPVMGVLGEHSARDAAREVTAFAREHAAQGGVETVPALHLIVAVAQPQPGPSGHYLARLDPGVIAEYVEAARAEGVLLFLDVQIGWADPLEEARHLERFLVEPFVHLALDPEFATKPQRAAPGSVIGTLRSDDVNRVQRYLAELIRGRDLPPKLLVLHQFMEHMLEAPERYEAHSEVVISVDMDGYGGAGAKLSKYDLYAARPSTEHTAIKLFFKWDAPMLTPAELSQLARPPQLVIYQ